MRKEIRELLQESGYQDFTLGNILSTFQKRYQGYMCGEPGFPHEMGVLLGYPVEDVRGFMEQNGQNALYQGYWKVYAHVPPQKAAVQEVEKMSKIQVVYWTQSGNTQAMAEAVGRGIEAAGKEAEVVDVSTADMDALKASSVFAMGCPAMGAEVLEEGEMEPFVEEVEGFAAGKKIALFGSYGWGDGQWMRDWVDRMTSAGATVVNGEGVICQEAPDDDAVAACESLGKQLAGM